MNIEVFYHLYIPNNEQSINWIWWVDSQLSLIERSKLSNFSNVNMCITMPYDWEHYHHIYYTKVSNGEFCTFGDYVKDYINLKYPFVNILDVRHTSEPNLYEGQTLSKIKEFCDKDEKDSFILYFHSKGSMNLYHNVVHRKVWKDFVDHHIVYEWNDCIKSLLNHDLVGVSDISILDKKHFRRGCSANFWWSKSSYIKTLEDPLTPSLYLSEHLSHMYEGQDSYRHAFEFWIHSNFPKLDYIKHFNTNIFSSEYSKLDFPDLSSQWTK